MAVIAKHNRNACDVSTICDAQLWLTFQMADDMMANQRLSEKLPYTQTRI